MNKISFQGISGAYSEIAAEKYFGDNSFLIQQTSFEEVILSVKKKKSNFGILPIENSIYGSVLETYDLLRKYKLIITSEVNLEINHCLLCKKKIEVSKLNNIFSHWQAIGQCSKFLKKLKHTKVQPFYDTAASALFIANEGNDYLGAIASSRAAEIYNLKILRKNIQNNKDNFTRFIIFGSRTSSTKNQKYKTSLCFELHSVPGSLYKALKIFADRNIDLLKIESRPIPHRPFSYIFYVDISGGIKSQNINSALEEIKISYSDYNYLGSYPIGKTIKT